MKQIVALGGGGFLMEPDNPLLDDFILRLTRKRWPRVCFVPTASGDNDKAGRERFPASRRASQATC
jgi:peptidase E